MEPIFVFCSLFLTGSVAYVVRRPDVADARAISRSGQHPATAAIFHLHPSPGEFSQLVGGGFIDSVHGRAVQKARRSVQLRSSQNIFYLLFFFFPRIAI